MDVDFQSVAGKTILILGGTGFLAKIFLVKILCIQPPVKKIYLVIRSNSKQSAEQRLQKEIFETKVFEVIKKELGREFSNVTEEKVVPICGNISLENLGIVDPTLTEDIQKGVDIIVNSAATTKFNERYDVALGINSMGAKNVMTFAEKCSKLKMLLHVSTAYVHGMRIGLLRETPLHMGETLNGAKATRLDIDKEIEIMNTRMDELRSKNASEKEITWEMKELGMERAKLHGWPNTYVFSKAIGEMLLGSFKEKVATIIFRPTIITSTYKDPFPGWIEGIRTIDTIFAAYGKGMMKSFIGNPHATIDLIPGDMVVNAMLAAVVSHLSSQPSHDKFKIYQVGTSLRNPVKLKLFASLMYQFLKKNPMVDHRGKQVNVRQIDFLSSFSSFQQYIRMNNLPFLEMMKFFNLILCNQFRTSITRATRNIDSLTRLAQHFEPYVFPSGIFDDFNTEFLRRSISESHVNVDIGFDPTLVQWEEYFMNIHFPGIVKYALK
ncbi:fatty acyl-CoA reductase 3-like [Andrographis paniculata]|uniref:fatty acyl-CoA reductase 3-like n=1 Tax=Andrographis paniculata TaxID=175694 RepID=UPI0021E879C4|nr:fatty acyl-CoA reductase 3-like [Andrographis paniculata]